MNIKWLMFIQDHAIDPEKGSMDLLGVFNRTYTDELPVPLDFFLAARLEWEEYELGLEKVIGIKVTDPSGNYIANGSTTRRAPGLIKWASAVSILTLKIPNLIAFEEGYYDVSLEFYGETKISESFLVFVQS